MLLALGISWITWSALFLIYWRGGDRFAQARRTLRGLVAGSILELIVSTPVHILGLRSIATPSKDDCYCQRGSYTGLVLGATVLLWTFGPGVALLYFRERERRTQLLKD